MKDIDNQKDLIELIESNRAGLGIGKRIIASNLPQNTIY